MAFLEGVSGCYLITHVSEAMPAPDSPLVKPESADLVKIWSFEHDAWWRPDSRGYTTAEADAGLYDRRKVCPFRKPRIRRCWR